MKKLIALAGAIALIVALVTTLFGTGVIGAQDNIPSTKAAVAFGAPTDIGPNTWVTIADLQIKTGEPKDLSILVTGETSLTTRTKITGDASSTATAELKIRVLVDTVSVFPGNDGVVFDYRLQRLSGNLTHLYGDPDHWVELYQVTKSCHAFNFFAEDVGSGIHLVQVQARKWGEAIGDAEWLALIGNVGVIVDEVNLKTLGNQF